MATILATWELGLRYGHIGHLAPVARAMDKRGHRTVLAARDVITALTAPQQPFAQVVQAPVYLRPPVARPTLTWGQVVADGGFTDVAGLTALVRAWLALFELVSPSLVLVEHAPASLLAAHVAGLPAARIGTAFSAPPATSPTPSMAPWQTVPDAELIAADAEADATIRAVCAALGVAPPDGVRGLLEGARDYLVTWPELDHFGPRADAFYYGPMAGLGGTARPDWPAGEGARTLVYLPFDHAAAGPLIEVLGALGWPVLWHSQKPPSTALPPSIGFVAEPFDMQHMMGEAAIFVGRVGHGSSADAIRGGCAQLLLPDTLETSMLAYRIVQARLGVLPAGTGDAAGLRAALDHLAGDAAIGKSVADAAARYGAYDPEAAARELADDLIEDIALS